VRFQSYRIQLNIALRQNEAQDSSFEQTQAETNTHFLAKFQPTKISLLSLLRHDVAADFTSTVEPSTPIYVVARFHPYRLNLAIALRQNIAADFTTVQTQGSTEPHFIGKFLPTKLATLRALIQNSDIVAPPASRVVEPHFVGKFQPILLQRNRLLSQNLAGDFAVSAINVPSFVGKFRPYMFSRNQALSRNVAADFSVVVAAERSEFFLVF
jgi:hypothetical protein